MHDIITSVANLEIRGADPDFHFEQIPWVLDLDASGVPIQWTQTASGDNEPKSFCVPRPVRLGSPNTPAATIGYYRINQFFPQSAPAKRPPEKWPNLWQQLRAFGRQLPKGHRARSAVVFVCKHLPSLAAVMVFPHSGRTNPKNDDLFIFRIGGSIIFSDQASKEAWRGERKARLERETCDAPDGIDIYSAEKGKLAIAHANVQGRPLASANRMQFFSYGLAKAQSGISVFSSEQIAYRLEALLTAEDHCAKFGGKISWIFWSHAKGDPASFLSILETPDVLVVRNVLGSLWSGIRKSGSGVFYSATLQREDGRFVLRNCSRHLLGELLEADTANQGTISGSLASYFDCIEAVRYSSRDAITLTSLAEATELRLRSNDQKQREAQAVRLAPLIQSLITTALSGRHLAPLPEQALANTVIRQRVEMSAGVDGVPLRTGETESRKPAIFTARFRSRAALLTLYFHRNLNQTLKQKNIMNPNDPIGSDSAVLCGRMLAILDLIHNKAHDGRSASSPANRFYASASTTPALVFPRLCKLARYHLDKYKNKGLARKHELGVPAGKRADGVDEDAPGLAQIADRILTVCKQFPRMLSLEEQGRFALGFYHERARKWPNYVKRKPDGSIIEAETEDDSIEETEPENAAK